MRCGKTASIDKTLTHNIYMKQHINWKASAEYPYVLNLDEGFSPWEKGVEILHKKFTFRGGEPHFHITSWCDYADVSNLVITQRYNKIGDLFDIILANDAARRMGFKNISLILPYFPAARQDRVCNDGEPLTIKVFADMINGCNFDNVFILCPHSEVTAALIHNVRVLDEIPYVEKVVNSTLDGHHYNIVCPDAGAGKRTQKIIEHLSNNNGHVQFDMIRCEKVRDVKDGSIKEFFVANDDLGGHPTLIVDDILCMGGTFKGLGNILRSKNSGKLMLHTTHADCVEGIQSMVEYFDHVYTTNSKRNYDDYTYTFSGKFTCLEMEL
jgi:ribose-phosphate pyrophosphokinase